MVRLWTVDEMRINKEVLNKIRIEEQKYPYREFGGYLVVKKNGYVKDIIFDVEDSNHGHVDFSASNVLKLPDKQQKLVNGWFHKHPINGLSGLDKNTIRTLTNFWGVCYTMVLQANGKILMLKTVKGKSFKNTDFDPVDWKFWKDKKENPQPTKHNLVVEVFKKELPFGKMKVKEPTYNTTREFKVIDTITQEESNSFTILELLKDNNLTFDNVLLTRQQVIQRLFDNTLKPIQYTGCITQEGDPLYEEDRVSFFGKFQVQKEGIIQFKSGGWKITTFEWGKLNEYNLFDELPTVRLLPKKSPHKEISNDRPI